MSNPNKTTSSQLIVLFKLAIPVILGNFAYAILGITDMLMAGIAGTPDQAGVAIGGAFFFPAITFIIGMLSALHPIISGHCGAQTKEHIPQDHAHAVCSSFIVGIILMAILLAIAFGFINMDSDQRMENVTRYYVVCVAFTVPICALYNSARAYCEAMGDTNATLYFGVLAVSLNVPLNYCFIFGKYGMPQLGGIGCGVATIISMTLSTLVLFAYITTRKQLKDYSWLKNKQGINFLGVISFTKLALPLGISSAVECSCFTLIALLLSPLGPINVSAHSIVMSIASFVFNIPLSIGIATSIMVGYAIGQNNLHTLRLNIKAAYVAILICIIVCVSILLIGNSFIPYLFSKDITVLTLASNLMFFAAANQLFESPQTIQAFILRGFKDNKTILLVTVIAFYIVALPIGVTLCYDLITAPQWVLPIVGKQGLTGPHGFWIGLFSGLLIATILYRVRVIHHYRQLKANLQQLTTTTPTDDDTTSTLKTEQALTQITEPNIEQKSGSSTPHS